MNGQDLITSVEKRFDEFNLKARVYPALLLALPGIVDILLVWPSSPLVRLAPTLVALGGLFFIADLARGLGQSKEEILIATWHGLPAQRALSLVDKGNPALVSARREVVEHLLRVTLPSKRKELANPQAALGEFDSAVKQLIPRVRGKEKDRLLHTENIRYNFRRNLFAIRSIAILVAAISLVLDSALSIAGYREAAALSAAAISAAALLLWLVVLRPAWVRQAGVTYSDRFYDALNSLRASESNGRGA